MPKGNNADQIPFINQVTGLTFADLAAHGMRACVVANQHGGANDGQAIAHLFQAAGLPTDVESFEAGTGKGSKLVKQVAKSGKYGLIMPFGGDGTINKAVTAAVKAGNLIVAPICGGTVNHVSRVLYGNHNSHEPWLNALRAMQARVVSIDVGCVEPHAVKLIGGEVVEVPKHLRKSGYFLLSASLGVEATITMDTPKRLKYFFDSKVPGAGVVVLAATVLAHLPELRPFAGTLRDDEHTRWDGKTRELVVANADYGWEEGGIKLDDGILDGAALGLRSFFCKRPDSAVYRAPVLYADVPGSVHIDLDGSPHDLTSDLVAELGQVVQVTYRYSTTQVPMLIPYVLPQPLLSKQPQAVPAPTAEVPLVDAVNFLTGSTVELVVQGSAYVADGSYVLSGHVGDQQVAVRVGGQAVVARSSSAAPINLGCLPAGSRVTISGATQPWGMDAARVLL